MTKLVFKPAILYQSKTENSTRWREFPFPKRERDGYTIAMFKYDSKRGGWCKPYFVVYFNSEHTTRDKKQYSTLNKAIKAANDHYKDIIK